MSPHSPTPWKSREDITEGEYGQCHRYHISCPELESRFPYASEAVRLLGRPIALAYEAGDARFIVTACNAHDDLVAACRDALKYFEACEYLGGDGPHPYFLALFRAALAKAGAEGGGA
jgi:hypothetical protein